LERCIAGNAIFEPLVLTSEQHKDIKRLHDHFRNDFAHFTPKGWCIEEAGLPRIVGAAVDAAEVLMRRHYVIVHMEEDQQQRLTDALATVRSHLPTAKAGRP
jgi:UDP-N-acetylenolpyruvoylglucosamine reductase